MKDAAYRIEIVEDVSSADFVFDAYGQTTADLFAGCAAACFSVMTDLVGVQPLKEYNLLVGGENIDELLFNFMAELIYLKDVEKVFFSDFRIEIENDEKSLKAVVAGEPIDYNKHVIKTDVKAVTYHGLHIKKDDSGYVTRMVLDL